MADTNPIVALVEEVENERPVFEFGGRTFTPKEKLDVRALVALKRGDIDRALVFVLGVDQTQELLDLDTDEVFDETVLTALFDVVAAGQGVTRGESSASSSS